MKYFIKKNGTFLSTSYDTPKDVVERIVADIQQKMKNQDTITHSTCSLLIIFMILNAQ